MSLIKCPECKKQISDKATACPHCGYQLAPSAPATPAAAPTTPKVGSTTGNSNSVIGLFLGVLAVIGVVLFCVFALPNMNNQNDSNSQEQEKTEDQGNITNDSDIDDYKTYTNKTLNVKFDFPEDYKVSVKDGIITLTNKDDDDQYIEIKKQSDFSRTSKFIDDYVDKLKDKHDDAKVDGEWEDQKVGDYRIDMTVLEYEDKRDTIGVVICAFKMNGDVYSIVGYTEDGGSDTATYNKGYSFGQIIQNIIKTFSEAKDGSHQM